MGALENEVAARLAVAHAKISAACEAAGRDPASVTLVAVSKTMPIDRIRAAIAAGQRLFGENTAQELREKADAIGVGAEWHFIGRLQTNKAKFVAGRATLVHSVDRVELARELDRRSAPRRMDVLVQVNVAREAAKGGVDPDSALDLCAQAAELPHLRLRGLMTVPPWSERASESRRWFEALAALAAQGRSRGLPLHDLSMGMSHDFEEAIAAGATLVRVGTAIFGPRS